MGVGVCRSCAKVLPMKRRGLCWGCFYKPDVRAQYPSLSKYAQRTAHGEVPDSDDDAGPPDAPTGEKPGTPGKVAVLESRASRRWQLWHPGDAEYDGAAIADRLIGRQPCPVQDVEILA
jgi:hypothetical protein